MTPSPLSIIILVYILFLFISPCESINHIHHNDSSHLNFHIADGCRYVYIDFGTNIGYQIRKVYEQVLFHPHSEILSYFERYFGKFRHSVCSFGFEANPVHTNHLQQLEESFRKMEIRVKMFTETAVYNKHEEMTFYLDPASAANNEWGAGLTPDNVKDKSNLQTVTVQAIDAAAWLKHHVLTRSYPTGNLKPAIVMKLDIEGTDMLVLRHLLQEGVLCSIDFVYVEHASGEEVAGLMKELKAAECVTLILRIDDEVGPIKTLELPHISAAERFNSCGGY